MRTNNFINYHFIDTMDNKFMSYLVGLLQTDGHLYENSRNRGKISIELGCERPTHAKAMGWASTHHAQPNGSR